MKNKKVYYTIILLLSMTICYSQESNGILLSSISFLDKNVEKEINNIINEFKIIYVHELTMLNLSGCNITNLSGIEKLTSLKKLYLSFNEIENLGILKKLKGLKILSLIQNKIINISFLGGLSELEELYLSDNEITDTRILFSLEKLRILHLDQNPISKADLDALEVALPDCYIPRTIADKKRKVDHDKKNR